MGGDEGHVGADVEPAVAGGDLDVEVEVIGGAGFVAIEEAPHQADAFAFAELAAGDHAVAIHRFGLHVEIAEADVLGCGVDDEIERLAATLALYDAVADGVEAVAVGVAVDGTV